MTQVLARAATHPRIIILSGFIFLACAWLVLSSFYTVDSISLPSRPLSYSSSRSHKSLKNLFHALHVPAVEPDASTFRDYGGQEWSLRGDAPWKESLGERLCIIDLDSRTMDGEGEVFSEGPLGWDDALGLSTGTLNHYLYASIHGYKYYYIRSIKPEDRRASWRKPPIITQLLKNHEVCLYLDSDAVFNHLDLPFEWLMNYWNFTPKKTAMAMALDPNSDNNKDKFKRVNLNTGFIISQNIPRTFEILDAWEGCPEPDSKYENCSNFRNAAGPGRPTDQGAFSTYIRYDFDGKDDIKELPCTEANGYPASHSGCNGDFVRHFWTGKHEQLKGGVGQSIAGALMQWGHEEFLQQKSEFFVEEEALESTS